ncbi:MAG: tail fiber protein [Cyclobacteriaceae bacterium]
MEEFIGTLKLFAGNFAPRGWAFCHGQLLPINNYSAVFSLLGTMYGGDGRTNFALPDLRGRVPVGFGQGPGLSNYQQGQTGGQESTTLTQGNMPSHNHSIAVSSTDGSSNNPSGKYPAQAVVQVERGAPNLPVNSYGDSGNATLAPQSVGNAGGNQPFENRQPYLGLNYIICLEGIFPSRQ